MHELSLCEDLMNQVTALAKTHHAEKVARIVVRIGPLSGIEAQLLESAFTISRVGTLAEDAELITEIQPVRIACKDCFSESESSINQLMCVSCGSRNTKLLSGDELILARVELENPN